MRFRITEDEWYPVLEPETPFPDPAVFDRGPEIDVDLETYRRWRTVRNEFIAMQAEIAGLIGEDPFAPAEWPDV